MEGFTYTDIFETKGIEYLVVITFLLMLIPFWVILNKRAAVSKQVRVAWDILTADILRIPRGLFYGKNHTWTNLSPSGNAMVGLDDFLLHVIGDFKINKLKSPGEMIRKGGVLAEIDQDGKTLKILSPISGKIEKNNNHLIQNPDLLHDDPYENGWLYSVKPSNWVNETKSYFLADDALVWAKAEIDRFKDFLAISMNKHSTDHSMLAFQEGGELRSHLLSDMDTEIWMDFQKEFLDELA